MKLYKKIITYFILAFIIFLAGSYYGKNTIQPTIIIKHSNETIQDFKMCEKEYIKILNKTTDVRFYIYYRILYYKNLGFDTTILEKEYKNTKIK
jgi:hypothetical protein